MPGKLVKRTFNRDTHPEHSESREHSQNSRKKQVREDTGNVKVTVSAEDNKRSVVSSDFLEDSQNSLSSGELEVKKGEANVVAISVKQDTILQNRIISPLRLVIKSC